MHLSHPSLDLVKSLEHGQRLERRKIQSNPQAQTADQSNGGQPSDDVLGWVPGRMATGGPGGGAGGAMDGGWQPSASVGDEGVYEGDSWKPSF